MFFGVKNLTVRVRNDAVFGLNTIIDIYHSNVLRQQLEQLAGSCVNSLHCYSFKTQYDM